MIAIVLPVKSFLLFDAHLRKVSLSTSFKSLKNVHIFNRKSIRRGEMHVEKEEEIDD